MTEEAEETGYYAIVGSGRTRENPSGIVRRRYTTDGRIDEAFQRDTSWEPTTAITQWEYGNYPGELIEIGESEAQVLIERFRQKWRAER